ncbi:MAG: vWA domain-containing protein [Aureliella sp.]
MSNPTHSSDNFPIMEVGSRGSGPKRPWHPKGIRSATRRGSILSLTAFLLPVLFILTAFTINLAYLQLTRTELMVSTDAAARACGRALSEFQDVDQAMDAAMVTAALNNVGGIPLRLSTSDADSEIEFGVADLPQGGDGRYVFAKKNTNSIRNGSAFANAVRISGNRLNSAGGSVEMPFPSFGLQDNFEIQTQAVAMQVDRDISLVLDRSGSMSWKTYNWPSGMSPWRSSIYSLAVDEGLLTYNNGYYYYASGVTSYDYQDWVWEEYYELGSPPAAPWDDLKLAVSTFLNVLEDTAQTEKVSLSSYSSWASEDLKLASNYQSLLDELETLGPSGATAIGSGMETGLPTLFEENYGRPLAAKTMIVMTDGMHNSGTDPVTIAQNIVASYNVTIHSVTFSPGADQARMQQVAEIGGGNHYHADTGAQLVDVFREIANNLPTIVTK